MKTTFGSLPVLAALFAVVSSAPGAMAAAPKAPATPASAHVVAMLRGGAQDAPAPAKPKAAFVLPDGPGKEPATRVCSACHSPSVFTKQRHDQAGWSTIINQMIAKGADGSDDDFAKILTYLTTNFGPDTPTPSAPATTPAAPSAPSH